MYTSVLILSLLATEPQTQAVGGTKTATVTKDLHTRAVEAMEKAAQAAQAAAEAAAKAAAAAEKATGGAKPAAGEAPAAAQPGAWEGTVGFGLIWLAGNSETLTLQGNVALQRKTESWIWGLKAAGAYGQALAAGATESQTTALNAGAQLRGDRRFTTTVTGYVAAGSDFDRVKSIKYRVNGEAGSSITWLESIEGDLIRAQLRTDLAARYTKESRYQYYPTEQDLPNVWSVAPRLGVAFRYGLSKDVTFNEDAEVLPTIISSVDDPASSNQNGRTLINSTSKVAVALSRTLSFAVALDLKFDSEPPAGKKDLDAALTIGLQMGL